MYLDQNLLKYVIEDGPVKNKIMTLALLASLAACSGGNPFDVPEEVDPDDVTDGEVVGDGEGTGIDREGIPPRNSRAQPECGDLPFGTQVGRWRRARPR